MSNYSAMSVKGHGFPKYKDVHRRWPGEIAPYPKRISSRKKKNNTATRMLLGAPGLTTRSKDTRGSWHRYERSK